jgi:hypothetical protein
MSWSGIASNQTVSCNNLQDGVTTGVFIPLSTIPVSQKQITKTEASSYVAIDTSYPSFSSKSANQLVVKNDLQPLSYSNRIYAIDDTNPYTPPGAPTYGTVIYSNDLGSTWSNPISAGYSVSRSGAGQYVLSGTQTNDIKVSSDYGVTFVSRSCTMSLTPGSVYDMPGTCVSDSGQYMYIVAFSASAFTICKSSDYGVTWTNIYYFPVTGFGQLTQLPYPKIACSGDGIYVTAIGNLQTGSFAWGSRIFKSSNYGASFSVNNFANSYWTDVAINTSGQYQLLSQQSSFGTGNVNGEGRIYTSSNYGGSFIEKHYNEDFRALYCDMSQDGQYMLVALINTNNTLNQFRYSTNYGSDFADYFNTNLPVPGIGQTPGGVFVNSDGTYALITYIDSAQITTTTNWLTWTTVSIPTAYTFGGLSKSRSFSAPGPTTTTTSTTANPNYDYYLADEYNCSGCNITSTNVLVAFPTGTSVIINRFYADASFSGFVYQITQSTSPGSPAVLLTLPSATTCNGACSL